MTTLRNVQTIIDVSISFWRKDYIFVEDASEKAVQMVSNALRFENNPSESRIIDLMEEAVIAQTVLHRLQLLDMDV